MGFAAEFAFELFVFPPLFTVVGPTGVPVPGGTLQTVHASAKTVPVRSSDNATVSNGVRIIF